MQNHLDPVSVAIFFLSPALGQLAAETAGPYAVIILAATVGAAWALGRRDTSSKAGAAFYFCRLVFMAVLVTWGLAQAISHYTGLHSSWLVAPIAMGIGWVGDDWPKVAAWLFTRFGRIFERHAQIDQHSRPPRPSRRGPRGFQESFPPDSEGFDADPNGDEQ